MREIEDRPELLELMLSDLKAAPPLYRPTNFWSRYQKRSYRWIRSRGIREFRSSKNPMWASFGAVADPLLGHAELFWDRGDRGFWRRLSRGLLRRAPVVGGMFTLIQKLAQAYDSQLRMLLELSYHYCRLIDPDRRVTRIGDSGLGSPNIVMEIEGQRYTLHFLRYFLQYLYLARFVDFDRIDRVIEIGGGYGGMAEVVLKLHPRIIWVDVDIPPQSYIASQYLAACFEGAVAGYDRTREKHEIRLQDYSAQRAMVLCPWQIPRLQGPFDLFVNSASFQEMEPEVVSNYAHHLDRLVERYGYVRALPQGTFVARRPGEPGVLQKTTRQHYVDYFHNFELLDEAPAEVLPNLPGTLSAYRDMMFVKTTASPVSA